MSDVTGLGRMDFLVGLTFEQVTSILFWLGGGVYLVWRFYEKVLAPSYIEDKKDVREFKQHTEEAAFQQVLVNENALIKDLIITKNQHIVEIRLAVEASAEEIMARIVDIEKRQIYLQAASQRQDATFTILNMNVAGWIDELQKQLPDRGDKRPGDDTIQLD